MVAMYVRKMNANRIGIDSSAFRTTAEANSSAFRTTEADSSPIRTTEAEYQMNSPVIIREDNHRDVHVHVHVHQKFELQVSDYIHTIRLLLLMVPLHLHSCLKIRCASLVKRN